MTKTITYTYPAPHEITPAVPVPIGTVVGCASTEIKYPTSDASTLGTWTFSAGATYFGCVDEAVTDDTDFITCTVLDGTGKGRQTFGFAAYALPWYCNAFTIRVRMRARRDAAGTAYMGGSIKVGGNYYDHADHSLGAGFANYDESWTYNPSTNLPWTVDEINGIGATALEGFGVWSDDCTPTVSCSQCYITVLYSSVAIDTIAISTADMPYTNYGEIRFVLWAWIVFKLPADMGVQPEITLRPRKWAYTLSDWTTPAHDADGNYVTLTYAIPWMEPSDGCDWRIWANRAGVELVYWAWGVYCTRYNPYGCLDSKVTDYTAYWDYEIPFAEAAMVPEADTYDIFHAWDSGAEAAGAAAHFQYIVGDPWVSQAMAGIDLKDEVWLGKAYLSDDQTAETLPFVDQYYVYSIFDPADYVYRMDTIITQIDLPDDTGGCSGDPICVWGSRRRCSTGGGVTLWNHTDFARKVNGLWDVQLLDATSSYGGFCFSRRDEVAVFSFRGGAACVWRSTDRGATWALSADVWPEAIALELLYVPMSDTIVALVWDWATSLYATQRSTDFGATWDAMVDIVGTNDDDFDMVLHTQFCHDESGGIHIVTHNSADYWQINHWHSHDLGATWTENATVLDVNLLPFPDGAGCPVVFAEGGKVLVALDVDGDDVAAGVDRCCYVMWATSTDGGDNFGAQQSVYMDDRTDMGDGIWVQMYGGEVYLYWIGWYDDATGILYGHYPGDNYYATFYVKSTGWGAGAPVFTDPGGGEVLHAGIIDDLDAIMAYRVDPNTQLSAHVIFEPSSWYLQYTAGPWGWWNWSGHIYEMNPTDWGPLFKTQDPGWHGGGSADCSLPEYYEYSLYGTAHMWLMQRANLWVQHI